MSFDSFVVKYILFESLKMEHNLRGPFGLVWGISADDVQSLGISIKPTTGQPNSGVSFFTTALPKSINDIDFVWLSFGYDDRLCRIEAYSRSFESDPYGYRVISRYKEIAASLSNRYGGGDETDIRDDELWKNQ